MCNRQCYGTHGGEPNALTNVHVWSAYVDRDLRDARDTTPVMPMETRQKRTARYRSVAFRNTAWTGATQDDPINERDSTGLWS